MAENVTAIVVLGGPDISRRIIEGRFQFMKAKERGEKAVFVLSSKGGLKDEEKEKEKRRWVTGKREGWGEAVKEEDYLMEKKAGTTVENALFCHPKQIMLLPGWKNRGVINKLVLITSNYHLHRSTLLFEMARQLSKKEKNYEIVPVGAPNPPQEKWKSLPHGKDVKDVDNLTSECIYESLQVEKDMKKLRELLK